jgi:UDP-N-acetyl-D-glucosamine dehydrogenase
LQRLGAKVTFSDPYVPSIRLDDLTLKAEDMLSACSRADCVVIVTDHSGIDYASVIKDSKLIVDTRNALKGFRSEKIVRL